MKKEIQTLTNVRDEDVGDPKNILFKVMGSGEVAIDGNKNIANSGVMNDCMAIHGVANLNLICFNFSSATIEDREFIKSILENIK